MPDVTRRTIFKELENALEVGESTLQPERLAFLHKVRDFISSGTWERKKGVSARVIDILRVGYTEASEKYGMNEAALRQVVKRASDTIKGLLGDGIVRIAVEGSDVEFKNLCLQFELANTSIVPSMKIQTDVLELVDMDAQGAFNLEDLVNEIEFLKRHTKKYLGEEMEKLDDAKLAFILRVLSSVSSDTLNIRGYLYRKIIMGE